MKNLLWKEFRENIRWAALIFALLVLAGFYGLTLTRTTRDTYSNITLCHSSFLIVTSFGFALAGLAYGCLQILPELRRDQWAFLLHRPLARWQTLLAKILVGVFFYAFTTLLPLAFCALYVAAPGNFPAPFRPALLLPALSDWLVGLSFYALAILICLNGGRWFGRRGILAVAGVGIFVLHLIPCWPFVLPVLAFAGFILAACGTVSSMRSFGDRPAPLRRAAVLSLLFASWMFLAFLVGSPQINSHGGVRISYEGFSGFIVSPDGRVLQALIEDSGTRSALLDLSGRDVTSEYPNLNFSGFDYLNSFAYFTSRPPIIESRFYFNRNSYRFVQSVYLRGDGRERWYYLTDLRYFIGYDDNTNRLIGIVDREGFKDSATSPAPFLPKSDTVSNRGNSQIVFREGARLIGINFLDRTSTPLYDLGTDDLKGFTGVPYSKPILYAAALPDRLLLLDPAFHLVSSIPYGHSIAGDMTLSIAAAPAAGRLFLSYKSAIVTPPGQTPPVEYIDTLDLQGHLLDTHEYQPKPTNKSTSWSRIALTAVAPPLFYLANSALVGASPTFDFRSSFPLPYAKYPALTLLLADSLILAALTFLISRRQARTTRVSLLWAAFVLLFGLPGLLTFRLASDWPVRIRCPHCRKKRDLARQLCPSCSTPWLPPAPNGAELLEPLATPLS